jgi:DNA invertase Pin-like site-specific DNA recombinase
LPAWAARWIQHLEACGVNLYLDQQAMDTTTLMGKLVFHLSGTFAEFARVWRTIFATVLCESKRRFV